MAKSEKNIKIIKMKIVTESNKEFIIQNNVVILLYDFCRRPSLLRLI